MADVNLNQCNHSSSLLSSLDWGFEYYNTGITSMGNSTPPPQDPDFSTGDLQDALTEWRSQSKRRRLLLHGDDDRMAAITMADIALQNYGYWNTWDDFCNSTDNYPSENWNTSNHSAYMVEHSVSDGLNSSMSSESIDNELVTAEGQENRMPSLKSNVASSTYKNSLKKSIAGALEFGNQPRKKLAVARVVYPFELVKPGGIEGDMTLNDINERILMPPTRPVKHPVGDFACRPCVLPNGPGLSGKSVVGFTKIHTQGRGTITIVRTRG